MTESADIRELAVAAWRLEKWLDNLNAERKMAAKSALRSIKKYISASGVEVKDPLGSKFDPGLAVEVVNNESDNLSEDELIITETLTPYIYRNGELIQHARVIIGKEVKEARENNEIITDSLADASSQDADKALSVPTVNPKSEQTPVEINPDDIERMMAYAKIL